MGRNDEVAAILYEIGRMLELQGVAFKPRAYERAAQNIEAHGEDVATLVKERRLGDIAGVGKAIAEKVTEFVQTGAIEYHGRLSKEIPEGLLAILRISGLGPKKAAKLYAELKISSVQELKAAAEAGRIRSLDGFGERSEAEILAAVDRAATIPDRFPAGEAKAAADTLLEALEATGRSARLAFAGSLRRGRDYVGDVDLLAVAEPDASEALMDALVNHPQVADVIARGKTKTSVRLKSGLQADLRVVPAEAWGAALMYFTGSKEHNVAVRARAQREGMTLNEYALTHVKTGDPVASNTEEEVFSKLGMDWVPPEIRENRGEVELAAKSKLPSLIGPSDIMADLHTHTDASDGRATLKEMLTGADRLGYSVYGVSDHSAGSGVPRGREISRFAEQRKLIDSLADAFPKIRVLQGSEVNIDKAGKLDLPAKTRKALDFVVGSVHSAFTLPAPEQTARIVTAIGSGIDILGHPTGRLMGKRPSLEMDFDRVAEACAKNDVLMEINASPHRLDLWAEMVLRAKEAGCRFVINSDAHGVAGLRVMPFGVTQARRGWLSRDDVVNATSWSTIKKFIGHSNGR